MAYIVREKDQWGAIRCKIDDGRIWFGEHISGMADMTITADPYDSDRRLVRRGDAQSEVMYCVVPDAYDHGYCVRERDAYGRILYFVESSRHNDDDFLVREGDQYGPVAFYVALAERGGGSGGQSHREPTLLDKIYTFVVYDLLFRAFMAPGKVFGKAGSVVAILGWITFLFLIGLALGLPSWYSILFGLLVMWGMFQVIGLYR